MNERDEQARRAEEPGERLDHILAGRLQRTIGHRFISTDASAYDRRMLSAEASRRRSMLARSTMHHDAEQAFFLS
jgi:hypothetical protein